MTNPVLAEATRGGQVESRHEGAFVVVDGDGKRVLAQGDIERPVFPRSAVKAIQALPFVESGAADRFGFGQRELAMACASHSGEPEHAEAAAAMLAKAGLDLQALECGAHWPTSQDATVALARAGDRPSALHNNCSGKHSGFICTCAHLGMDHRGYVDIAHGYQRLIAGTMSEVTGAAHAAENAGVDGCSIPTYAVPLEALARGFARMTTGLGLEPERARAATRLIEACMAEPFYVAGTGKLDTELMKLADGKVFIKVGAEGVYCGAIPELGYGFALKIDDGAIRAAEAAVVGLLAKLLAGDEDLSREIAAKAAVQMTNWNGIEVGQVRAAGPLAIS